MSFNVSYSFIARDAFTSISRKVNNSSKRVRAGFKKLGDQFKRTGDKFKRTSRDIKKSSSSIGSSLKRVFVGGAVFLGFKKLIDVGAEFQESMLDLSAITGATGKDLDRLKQKTFDLAKATSSSQAQILTAFKLVASAKPELLKNIPALEGVTEQVLLLKNAAGIELRDAAEITAQALNIFGKDAKFAGKFVDILAAGAKFGASEIGDTGAAVLLAGPAARAAGLDFMELNAAIQATALGGIKGARAGTALNAIFGRLRRAGLDIQALGLPESFELIKSVLDKITDSTKRAQLEAQIFGEEHAKVGLSLVNNIDNLRGLQKNLKTTGVAQEQATIRLSSFNAKMRSLGAIIREKLIQAFLKLEPTILEITEKFGKFIDSITPEQITLFISGVSAAIKVAVALIEKAMANIKDLFKTLDLSSFDSTRIDSVVKSIEDLLKVSDLLLAPGRFGGTLLKGAGEFIGQSVGKVVTRGGASIPFTQPVSEMFSSGGRLLGVGLKREIKKTPLNLQLQPAINARHTNATIVEVISKFLANKPAVNNVSPASALFAPAVNTNNTRADVNINLAAPRGTIENVNTTTSGNRRAMNLGVNVETQ